MLAIGHIDWHLESGLALHIVEAPLQMQFIKPDCCRLRLDASDTVQCPSVAYQLAGAKKIQQDLSSSETLER